MRNLRFYIMYIRPMFPSLCVCRPLLVCVYVCRVIQEMLIKISSRHRCFCFPQSCMLFKPKDVSKESKLMDNPPLLCRIMIP